MDLATLKSELDRLRSEHTTAHEMARQALRVGNTANALWLCELADDLFREYRKIEARMAAEMERGR